MSSRTIRSLVIAASGLLVPWCCGAQAAQGSTAAPAASAAALALPIYTGLGAVVELTKSLAWPLVALLVAVWFRKPIGDFIGAIGGRISKLSVFSLQLELTAAKPLSTTPLLDDIRAATSSALVSDSSRMMLEQAQSTEPADFSIISLGDGEEWLTSRLFIATVMMERMRGVKVFVFVERTPASERQFVAVANVRQLRWALARRFPWLQAALVRAEAAQSDDPQTTTQVKVISDTGAVEPYQARQLVSTFIAALQRPPIAPTAALPPATAPADWVHLGYSDERARWITRALLVELLPQSAFNSSAKALGDESRARRSRALLRCPMAFVALLDERREFLRLVNRQAYLEDVAASLGEEPESSAVIK